MRKCIFSSSSLPFVPFHSDEFQVMHPPVLSIYLTLLATELKCMCFFRDELSFAGKPFPPQLIFFEPKVIRITIAFC